MTSKRRAVGGLYNEVVSDGNEWARAAILLRLLGGPDPGRLRDAWVEKNPAGQAVIAIYTRNGGGNRECYCEAGDEHTCLVKTIKALQAHELYIKDVDDEFDCTYATFYFEPPKDAADMLAKIATDHVDTSQRWRDAIDAIGPSDDR